MASGLFDAGDVVIASVGDLASSASASGQLLPRQQARLALTGTGLVEAVHVRDGDHVRAGDVLVQLETDALARAVETARQNLAIQEATLAELLKDPDSRDVAAAEAAVANTQAQLDDLLAGPSEEELAQAQAALVSAQTRMDDLLAGPSVEELAQARAALTSARANLKAAEARTAALDDQLVAAQNDIHNAQTQKDRARDAYEQLVWNDWKAGVSWGPYSPAGVAVKKAQVSMDWAIANRTLTEININDSGIRSVQAQVAQAEANLALLTEDKTVQIAAVRSQLARSEKNLALLTEEKTVQIANARAQVAQAQASLERLMDGASEEQVATARARVEQARISLQDAQAVLDKAALVAPFDGLVTDVYVAIGEQASGPAVELVNTDSMHVVLDVDEVDLGEIEVGQETRVDLEAWPELEFEAEVASIAPQAKNIAGTVTYEVWLSVDWGSDPDAGGIPILTGMTANADLITGSRENVLLVPNQAITADRDEGTYYVYRVSGEDVREVRVTIGLRDRTHTEITSGLQEGDEVVIDYAGARDAGGFGRRGPFGGG
jgi:HlyD family secretion protein